jgi:purine catabolism regulator
MKFTVQDALNIENLRGAKVVGGANGLDREVRFVNIMEVPDVRKWMKGGEFLVTAGFAFQERPALLDSILDDLKTVGVAAFGIKLGAYFSEIPPKLIEHANRLDIPLIELPRDVPYMDFMLPIFETLMMHQYSVLKRVERTHEQLIDLSLRGEGIIGICRALEQMLETPVFILDKYGNCMDESTEYSEASNNDCLRNLEIIDFIHEHHLGKMDGKRIWNQIPYKEEEYLLVIPIEINKAIVSYLVVWERNNNIDEISKRAIEHAATAIALDIAKEQAVFDSEQKIRGELLEELIWKRYKNEDAIIKRARFCNLNIRENLAVFVLDIDEFEEYIEKNSLKDEEQVQSIKEEIIQIARRFLSHHLGHTPLLTQRSDSVIGVIPFLQDDEEVIRGLFKSIYKEVVSKIKGMNVTIGIGRANQGFQRLNESFIEAEQTVRVLRSINDKSGVGFFKDQGAYCILSELRESPLLDAYYNDTIGKLIEYDRINNSELIKTLVAYYKSSHNIRETSEEMYMHRNSIIYRIKKIEEITGRSLSSPEDNFDLQMGLKVHMMLGRVER